MNKYKYLLIAFIFCFGLSCTRQTAIYISPDGDDSGKGTPDQPFLTLERARDEVREMRKNNPEKVFEVIIRGGTYPLDRAVIFSSGESGSNDYPVIYRASEGEEPVFTGSKQLKNWHLLRDPDKLELLDHNVRGKVYMTDVRTAGIEDFGDAIEIGNRPDLFCNGELQTLARWPDEGFTIAGSVRGDTELPMTYINKRGTVEGVFEYTDNYTDRWAKEDDPVLGGYWYWDWRMDYQAVEKIDTLSNTVYIEEPYHQHGYRDSLRYFGLNLFCEIDRPGEWYLDRDNGILYWYPHEEIDISNAEVTLSVFNDPYMVEINNCSNLTLKGLTFREARGTGILISEGENCTITDCRIERFGQDGIHVDNGTGHGISGCLLHTFGCGGIKMKGGDRKDLTPANHYIENTIVEHFSLFKRTYEPAVLLEGCGSRLNNNRFRYSSSSAMRLEGNDFIVEYNQISHVVNESDDQGGLDMWYNPSYRGIIIRYNHWSDIYGGTRHGAAGVRLDDMISGVQVYGNIFERVGSRHFGGVQIHGGKDNVVENNLFYKCFAAVSFSPWGEKRWLEQLESPVIMEKIYNDVDIRTPAYQNKYPGLKNLRENPDMNIVKNNLLVDCRNRFLRDNDRQVFENNTSIEADSRKLDEFCDPQLLEKYGLQPIPCQEIGPKNNKWTFLNLE
jgi:hypothetical protein